MKLSTDVCKGASTNIVRNENVKILSGDKPPDTLYSLSGTNVEQLVIENFLI